MTTTKRKERLLARWRKTMRQSKSSKSLKKRVKLFNVARRVQEALKQLEENKDENTAGST